MPSVRAKAARVSMSMGVPSGMPPTPASDPEAGMGVCSRAQGTSLVAPWFIEAWVASDRGTLSHFSAGKVLQAWTKRSPQIPAQDRPETRNTRSMADIQKPTVRCSDFHKRRPRAAKLGTSTEARLSPLRGHQR